MVYPNFECEFKSSKLFTNRTVNTRVGSANSGVLSQDAFSASDSDGKCVHQNLVTRCRRILQQFAFGILPLNGNIGAYYAHYVVFVIVFDSIAAEK